MYNLLCSAMSKTMVLLLLVILVGSVCGQSDIYRIEYEEWPVTNETESTPPTYNETMINEILHHLNETDFIDTNFTETSDMNSTDPDQSPDTSDARIFRPEIMSSEPPEFCFEPMHKGGCRARMLRYYYDQEKNECVQFIYGGCGGNTNRFTRKADCETICYRERGIEGRGTRLQCTLKVQMLEEKCQLTSDRSRIAACGPLALKEKNENRCRRHGCCWHHSYKICYNYAAEAAKFATCEILYSDRSGFIGRAKFRSNYRHDHGWVGIINFSNPVTGEFCMLKDFYRQLIIVGEKFSNDMSVVLQGTRVIYEGQNVNMLFAGSFGKEKVSKGMCERNPRIKPKKSKN